MPHPASSESRRPDGDAPRSQRSNGSRMSPGMQSPATRWLAPWALLPGGWLRDVLIECDERGQLTRLTPGSTDSDAIPLAGVVVPGLPNVPSQAFQRSEEHTSELP